MRAKEDTERVISLTMSLQGQMSSPMNTIEEMGCSQGGQRVNIFYLPLLLLITTIVWT